MSSSILRFKEEPNKRDISRYEYDYVFVEFESFKPLFKTYSFKLLEKKYKT